MLRDHARAQRRATAAGHQVFARDGRTSLVRALSSRVGAPASCCDCGCCGCTGASLHVPCRSRSVTWRSLSPAQVPPNFPGPPRSAQAKPQPKPSDLGPCFHLTPERNVGSLAAAYPPAPVSVSGTVGFYLLRSSHRQLLDRPRVRARRPNLVCSQLPAQAKPGGGRVPFHRGHYKPKETVPPHLGRSPIGMRSTGRGRARNGIPLPQHQPVELRFLPPGQTAETGLRAQARPETRQNPGQV